MLSIGLDIGGANTKMAVIRFDDASTSEESLIQSIRVESLETVYHPIWERLQELPDMLTSMLAGQATTPHLTTLTMTAELADCFGTKREGVVQILSMIERIEPSVSVLLNNGKIVDLSTGLREPGRIAAANWVAPSLLIGRMMPESLFIDVGSTTTDIIPISGGSFSLDDPSDMGRLANHQLVYTGALRTNVATITDHVIINGQKIYTASENFSTTGDVNLVLGLIEQSDYTVPTSDGQPATFQGALRRLSRVICSDLEHLTKDQVEEMAKYIHQVQVTKTADHISRLIENDDLDPKQTCVVAGMGISCLAEPAARAAGLDRIITFHELLTSRLGIKYAGSESEISAIAPAISLSILGALGTINCG